MNIKTPPIVTKMILGILVITSVSYLIGWYNCNSCDCRSNNKAIFIEMATVINDTVFDLEVQNSVQYLMYRNCRGGFCFGMDNDSNLVDQKVIDFIEYGVTIAIKRRNEPILSFVNPNDTITVLFTERNKRNGVLTKPIEIQSN